MGRAGLAPAIARSLRAAAARVDGESIIDHDQLTGLARRDALIAHLHRLIADGRAPTVLYVDLDDFKLVNDSLGHSAGDELLRRVADRMSQLVGAEDLLARQGGDEFVFASAGRCDAVALAERLRDLVTDAIPLRGVPVSVGVSIGIATWPGDGEHPEALLEAADAAMYEAKRTGRNQIRVSQPGRRRRAVDRDELELTTTLPAAIERDELVLHWQPLVDVHDLSVLGLEALVRWQHPERGLLYPGAFLPFAERTGLIHSVDEWVAAAVSRQRVHWQARGLDPYVGFNLAPQFARRPGALASLLSRLTVDGLSLDHVTVELIESEALREDDRLVEFLEGLHAAGVTVSLDDFGRAYSSLDRLRDVPARWVKLDRAFMDRVPGDGPATQVLLAILDLIRALKLEIIVEGIERPEQLQVLRDHGHVRAAQGFLLGRPAPAAELEARLRSSAPSQLAPPVRAAVVARAASA